MVKFAKNSTQSALIVMVNCGNVVSFVYDAKIQQKNEDNFVMEATFQLAGTAIIHELLDQEVIIANLNTGIYYSLRETSVAIWQLLLTNHSLAEIAQQFSQQYALPVTQIIQSVSPFVSQLLQEELIIENQIQTPSSQPSGLIWSSVFTLPTLEKFEEMSALLMLDPIHEVDEQGWPVKSAESVTCN